MMTMARPHENLAKPTALTGEGAGRILAADVAAQWFPLAENENNGEWRGMMTKETSFWASKLKSNVLPPPLFFAPRLRAALLSINTNRSLPGGASNVDSPAVDFIRAHAPLFSVNRSVCRPTYRTLNIREKLHHGEASLNWHPSPGDEACFSPLPRRALTPLSSGGRQPGMHCRRSRSAIAQTG